MKRFTKIGLGLVVAGICFGVSTVRAAETKTKESQTSDAKAGEKSGAMNVRAIPFQGSVVSVDPAAKTFTLNGKEKERIFKVVEQTEILVDNKPVHFNAITVGAEVRGNALRREDFWEAKKVSVGPKSATPASETKK